MSDNKDYLLSSYNYELDPELIAQRPVSPRHNSRLLIVTDVESISSRHTKVWNWQDELRPGDLIVVNNTKVVKARLPVRRSGGGVGELLLLEPRGDGKWLCLAKPAKRMHNGDCLFLEAKGQAKVELKVHSEDQITGGRIIEFPSICFDFDNIQELLDDFGEVPLPPYIKGSDEIDSARYQTSYATCPGAVAAPTAGLHLSKELLQSIKNKGVDLAEVTLHVGLGTFKPLKKESLNDLRLHSEWVEVKEEVVKAIESCHARGGRVMAVGTTTVRALEGAYAAGNCKLSSFKGMVELVIKPGYRFGVVDGLLTNFHLPKSSLLLLVSSLIGRKKLFQVYKEAIALKYRFFSYGDAMWIPPEVVLTESKSQLGTGS